MFPSHKEQAGAASQAGEPAPAQLSTEAIQLPAISLPKGGGAIRGIGEKFSANLATGSSSFNVPITVSPSRSGFQPEINLSYSSGAGNSPFGIGWSLDLSTITRKTNKGLPRYLDAEESDVFLLSGMEDLVPLLDGNGQRIRIPRTVNNIVYQIFPYRPRIESPFSRIERWLAVGSGISHWRTINRDNVTSLYGFDEDSRVADPNDPRKIFSFLLCRRFDDKGNLIRFNYLAEDGAGIDLTQAHEVNRASAARAAQRYLKSIRYGNTTPYFANWQPDQPETALPAQWLFTIVLDYGDHDPAAPQPTRDRDWPVRPDPFSTRRPAFELRAYRRCKRVLVFHNFPAETTAGAETLVRSTDLTYSDEVTPGDPRNPIYTFIQSITQCGYRRQNGGYLKRTLPPLEFEYSQPVVNPAVLIIDYAQQANFPEGLDNTRFRWVDLDGEGLSGVLSAQPGPGAQPGIYAYRRNLSPLHRVAQPDGSLAARASFGPLEPVTDLPGGASLSRRQFLDLSGDGKLDVVELNGPIPGFYERTDTETWQPYRPFRTMPQIDWSEPNLKFIDLTGDGLADALLTEDGLFTFWQSLGADGYAPAGVVRVPWDEERGPHVVLADSEQTLFLADMDGDGLSDLLRVRNGEACYWPNLGYGRFGPKVSMDSAPHFTADAQFDPGRVRTADIDGSGTTDLLYLGEDGVQVYFNQSGNRWSAGQTLAVFPSTDTLSSVQAIDLLGSGTACLVWSSPLPGETYAPLRYVDLMSGQKPHLLTAMRNNLGAETRLRYAPSTYFYLADRQAGQPWITRLPFPVQVLERVEVFDWVGRSRFVTRYAYHHGYFDGVEREFRGFGRVDQWDTEEHRTDTAFPEAEDSNWDAASWSPPVQTRTWFHTGAFADPGAPGLAGAVSQQYQGEYWGEPALSPADRAAMLLPDTVLPPGLLPTEIREAYRALKGQVLRVEVFAEDGGPNQGNPYTVTEQNFTLACLQPLGPNRHAVFYSHPREKLTFHYERGADDPRVTHEVTLETDAYGSVRRSVSAGYPRRPGYPTPEPLLSANYQAMLAYDQGRMHLRAVENQYTNALDDPSALPDTYRAPLTAERITAELTGLVPTANRPGVTNLFTFTELDAAWQTAWDGAHDAAFEDIPAADIDGSGSPASALTRRILRRTRTLYRKDDLTALLAPGELEPLALPGETYRLALNPAHLQRLFGSRVNPVILAEGGYVQLADGNWWAPTGRVFYSPGDNDSAATELATARAHFYRSRRYVDPFGGVTRLTTDAYDLLTAARTDALANTVSAENDYRVLQPWRVTDANGNRAEAAYNALGLLAGTALRGKASETLGDLLTGFVADLDDPTLQAHLADPLANPEAILGQATTRMVYDLFAYYRTRANPQPDAPAAYSLARETHVADLGQNQVPHIQHTFSYSDGLGHEIQKKVQAKPGAVRGGPDADPRWLGSGWTILNNKGKPVRRFEPFFTPTHRFEFAPLEGVSDALFYDPVGRQVAVLHPDQTWEKVVFDPWRQVSWDGNDTVDIADPRADGNVGAEFLRLLGAAPGAFTSWYNQRITGTLGGTPAERAANQDAAQKAGAQKNTPSVTHFDALGRACLSVADNASGQRLPSRTALDTEGQPLALIDPLERRASEFCLREPQNGGGIKYVAGLDMLGGILYQNNQDAGPRWSLGNIANKPLRAWDSAPLQPAGHAFRYRHDLLRRPTHIYVSTGGAAEILLERSVYGEGHPALNLNGQIFRLYDSSGLVSHDRYDFKGNLVESTRQLAADYHQSPDWMPLEDLTDPAALDAAVAPLLSTVDRYQAATRFDALNRPIQTVTPHRAGARLNVIQTTYAVNGLVDQADLWLRQSAAPGGMLTPASADQHAVTAIDYNARGQRAGLALGAGTQTDYTYDPLTFRLVNLTTARAGSFPANQRIVQDLSYTYDPVGNVTFIRDDADTQNVIFFRNQRVEPSASYTYDAIYRLVQATGREHLGQTNGVLSAPQQINNDDGFRFGLAHPGDGNAMGNYTEVYSYDSSGNLTTLAHQVSSGSWTRHYTYSEASRIDPTQTGNRLSTTSLPGDPNGGPYSAHYSYDDHGSALAMPHLAALTWDELERLRSTTRQAVNNATPDTTWYTYESGGQRIRKASDRANTTRRAERIYLGGFELYREFDLNGTTPTFERETVAVSAAGERVLIVETDTLGGATQLYRYQYPNHLGTAVLELSQLGEIISYEENFPYGSTSYQAVRSQVETPKRYRFSGKERDPENDLYYFGARYYIPWLGRWISPDPAQTRDGLNLFAYARGAPTRLVDPTGTQNDDPPALRLPTPSLLDSRSAEERLAQRYAHVLGDFHLQTGGARQVELFPTSLFPRVPIFANLDPTTPTTPPNGGSGSASAENGTPVREHEGPGVHASFSPFLPHLDVYSGSVHFITDVGFGSTTLKLTGIGRAGLDSLALEGKYSGAFTFTARNPEGSVAIGYDISSQTGKLGFTQPIPGGGNVGFSFNTRGVMGLSVSGGGPYVPLVRNSPGSFGVSAQDFGDPFRAAEAAGQSMLGETRSLLDNPAAHLGPFISEHSATGPGHPESDFTNIGRGVDAVKAVGTPAQHRTGPDIRYGAALTLDPNLPGGRIGVRFTAGLQIVY